MYTSVNINYHFTVQYLYGQNYFVYEMFHGGLKSSIK